MRSSSRSARSTSTSGAAARAFITFTSVCPPASGRAPSYAASSETASSTVVRARVRDLAQEHGDDSTRGASTCQARADTVRTRIYRRMYMRRLRRRRDPARRQPRRCSPSWPTRPSSSSTSTRPSTPARPRCARRCAPRATDDGDRVGFGGRRYRTDDARTALHYLDDFDDYLAFLEPRLRGGARLLSRDGTLYFHIDYREAHYCKVLLDDIFGPRLLPQRDHLGLRLRRPRDSAGPPSTTRSSSYVKDPTRYTFNPKRSTATPTWPPASSTRREGRARQAADRRLVAHDRPPDRHARRPATRPRSPWASSRRIVARLDAPGDLRASTSSPGSGTLGAAAATSAAASSSSTRAPKPSRSCARRLAALSPSTPKRSSLASRWTTSARSSTSTSPRSSSTWTSTRRWRR